ncbi:rRNA maturation RNase YbeY [bacterium]|nr:rRNA maturation RNase YbeY [bacterium]
MPSQKMGHDKSERIFVANAHPSIAVDQRRVRRLASAVLEKESCGSGKVNIILATDADLTKLNFRYLRRDRPTDVLSFPMGEDKHVVPKEQVIGEIYISLDRARQQAQEYNVSLTKEVDRLVFHGLLHLCGYDHEDADDAQKMRAKEEEFLERFR